MSFFDYLKFFENIPYYLNSYTIKSPFPKGLDDSFKVLKYVCDNAASLFVDKKRVILMGDSAGGGIITVMQKRIIEHNMISPILYVPIYPWLNLVDYQLPSGMSNKKENWKEVGDVFSTIIYAGINRGMINKAMVDEIFESKHVLLILDVEKRKQIFNYLDYNLVPEQYRTGHGDYTKLISDHKKLVQELTSPNAKLDENSELFKNKEFAKAALNCFNPESSPSFLDDSILSKFSETFMIICEKDELKDENFIFAERLKRNGVKTTVAYSKKGYHGIISDTYKDNEALRLFNQLVAYIVKKVCGD